MASTEKGRNQEQAIVRCQMRDGQTEPWKEPPSVSINRTYLNSNTNLKTTEGKTQPRTQEQRKCMDLCNPRTEFKERKQEEEQTRSQRNI